MPGDDQVHLPELMALPVVINARRYRVTAGGPDRKTTYAAFYEVNTDPDAAMAVISGAVKDGTVRMSDAIDVSTVEFVTLKLC